MMEFVIILQHKYKLNFCLCYNKRASEIGKLCNRRQKMIQEIAPHILDNEYKTNKVKPQDYLLIFHEDEILLKQQGDEIEFPKINDLKEYSQIEENNIFLFSIDKINFFLNTNVNVKEDNVWKYKKVLFLKEEKPMWKVFAATLGGQLNRWYVNHRFCGRCQTKLKHSDSERALRCSNCGLAVYPTISPSVIVAITNGDKILLIKYAYGTYKKYALVAGYTEVGETLEQTVAREVMEEVGLNVKNITYYKSQPWPFTDTLLMGYFAEVDGDDTVTLQESELSEAKWFKREEIPYYNTALSVTNEMIEVFRNNKESEIYKSRENNLIINEE